jgi:hypothetical protein
MPTGRLVGHLTVRNVTFGLGSIESAVVHSDEYMHEALTVSLNDVPLNGVSTLPDAPVSFEWGRRPNDLRRFVGYVHTATPTQTVTKTVDHRSAAYGRGPVELRCVGATQVMQSGDGGVWTNRTVPSVAAEIAAKYRLNLRCDPNTYVWPSLGQGMLGDWAWMNELARMIGYVLTVRGTTIYMRDPAALVQRGVFDAPVVAYADQGPRTVSTFSPRLSDRSVGFANYVVDAVSSLGNPLRYQSADATPTAPPMGTKQIAPRVTRKISAAVQDYGGAMITVNAMNRPELWPLQGPLQIAGLARVDAGTCVNVIGVGADYSGLWYVRSVEHTIVPRNAWFFSKLQVAKDSWFPEIERMPAHRFDDEEGVGGTAPPPVLLPTDQWVSAWTA